MAWTHHMTFRVVWLLDRECRGRCGFHATSQEVTHCKITHVRCDMGKICIFFYGKLFLLLSIHEGEVFHEAVICSEGLGLASQPAHTHRPALMTMSSKVQLKRLFTCWWRVLPSGFRGRSVITGSRFGLYGSPIDWKDVTSLYCHL